MIELIAKFSTIMKTSTFPIFMFTAFYKHTEDMNIKLSKNDFSNDDVPGDNFPYIVMTSHGTH